MESGYKDKEELKLFFDKKEIPKDFDTDKLLGNVKKRDNKARSFAPPDNTTKSKKIIDPLESAYKDKEELKLFFDKKEIPKDFDIVKLLGNENKYVNINLSNVNNLIDEMKKKLKARDNILDIGNNKSVNFNDILIFLQNIIDGEVDDFNKEKKYNEKFKDVEKNLEKKTKDSNDIILYNHYLNYLKRLLFSTKKSSGKGLTISDLPILLSKIYTDNSSKEITNEIKQLTKKLYDNKQITKQLYNILNKALRQSPEHL